MRIWLLIALLGFSLGANANIPDQSVSQLQTKIKALESALARVEKNIKRQQTDLSTSERELQLTDQAVNAISQDIKKTQHSISKTKQKIQKLNIELTSLEKEQAALVKRLQAYVQGLHLHQQDNPLKWLLQQNKLSDIQKLGVWYEYFANSEAELLKALKDKSSQTKQAKVELSQEKKLIQQLGQAYTKQHVELQKKRSQQVQVISQLKHQLKDKSTKKQHISKQHQGLNKLLVELEKVTKLEYIEVGKNFDSMLGRLPLPISYKEIEHEALSKSYLEAKEGTRVHAIHPGRVVFSEWLRGLGLLLIIDHGHGYMSLYGNNQVLFKATGDWVNQGDQIALVGKSGGLPKPGLYFEIRKDGTPLDTSRWISNG
jgi:murein hydrolase activator